jgi:transposase-like protein
MRGLERCLEVVKVVTEVFEPRLCKYCQSRNTVKYGKVKGVQRWWCKDCKRKFAGTDTVAGSSRGCVSVASAATCCSVSRSEARRRKLNRRQRQKLKPSQ